MIRPFTLFVSQHLFDAITSFEDAYFLGQREGAALMAPVEREMPSAWNPPAYPYVSPSMSITRSLELTSRIPSSPADGAQSVKGVTPCTRS